MSKNVKKIILREILCVMAILIGGLLLSFFGEYSNRILPTCGRECHLITPEDDITIGGVTYPGRLSNTDNPPENSLPKLYDPFNLGTIHINGIAYPPNQVEPLPEPGSVTRAPISVGGVLYYFNEPEESAAEIVKPNSFQLVEWLGEFIFSYGILVYFVFRIIGLVIKKRAIIQCWVDIVFRQFVFLKKKNKRLVVLGGCIFIICMVMFCAPKYRIVSNGSKIKVNAEYIKRMNNIQFDTDWDWVLKISLPVVLLGGFLLYLLRDEGKLKE